MKKGTIPRGIKDEVERIVEEFNEKLLAKQDSYYFTRYNGRFLYLDRSDSGRVGPICRLEYTGTMDSWRFAIYKFSAESYDPKERFFPGMDLVDGTVEGAMKAGLDAYS